MDERPANLNRAVKAGTAWLMLERGGIQALNFVASMILARLLAPEEFGVFGVALMFTGLSSRLAKFGFGMAFVRLPAVRPDHTAALFVIMLVTNGAIALGLMAASPFVATFFRSALAGQVLAVMSLNFLVRCLGGCPSALLRRRLDFRSTTIGGVTDGMVKLVVSCTLAFQGFGVWSLVYAELVGGISEKLFLVRASGWWPSLRASRAAIRDLFGFGMGISLKSTFTYLTENVDNFIIGRHLGLGPLGFYEKAYRLMNLPVAEISARLNAVLFPVFARIHDDGGRLRAALRKTVLTLTFIGYPLFGTLVVLGPQLIAIMYGPAWTTTIVPFQILCLVGPMRIITNLASSVINATGSIGPEVRRRMVLFVLLIVAVFAGASLGGINGVAVGVAVVNVLGALMMLTLLCRVTSARLVQDLWVPQSLPLAGAGALAIVGYACREWAVSEGFGALGVVVLAAPAGAAAYAAVLFLARTEALVALALELRGDLAPVLARVPLARALVAEGRRL
jgi:O-antigen/teichoic acid export membrane protein